MTALGIILAHLVGDYILQSDWMAKEKTTKWLPAFAHGVTYTIPYAFVTQSPLALSVICLTHVVIDRFRLAKYLVWAKNQIAPKRARPSWEDSKATGYPSANPAWLSTWLLFLADNTIHLAINWAAVVWL